MTCKPSRIPYDRIQPCQNGDGSREPRMRAFADALWAQLAPSGVSWLGFYLHDGQDHLILGPRRDKPACSPLGLHGVCGRAFREKRPIVVSNVSVLGENYVACDPQDRSELVVPLFEPDATCWGVLDLDSHELGAFTQADVDALVPLLRMSGLTAPAIGVPDAILL